MSGDIIRPPRIASILFLAEISATANHIQIQNQLYWPGLRTYKDFDFGPFALYVQHSTLYLLLIYKKEKHKTENCTKK